MGLQTVFFFARKYFWGKKKYQSINLITGIASGGIAIGTCALIILLSAFNGLEQWAIDTNNLTDPELKISANNNSKFVLENQQKKALHELLGPDNWYASVEGNALAIYGDRQTVVTVKGVGKSYLQITPLDSLLVDGAPSLGIGDFPEAISGAGVAYQLGLSAGRFDRALQLYVPKDDADFNNLAAAFRQFRMPVAGIIQSQPEFDERYIIVPEDVARQLFNDSINVSQIECSLAKGISEKVVKQKLNAVFGDNFKIQNRFEQHEILYKVIRSEKWMLYLILSFILLIASFTLFGSVAMIIVDKQDEIKTLRFLGMPAQSVQNIFFTTGMYITGFGALIGWILGLIMCYLQIYFGWIKVNPVDAYPIVLQFNDFLLVFITVLVIGTAASYLPSLKLREI